MLWNVSHCHSVAAVSVIWSSKANIGPESSVRKYQFARDCWGLAGIVVLAAAPALHLEGGGRQGAGQLRFTTITIVSFSFSGVGKLLQHRS